MVFQRISKRIAARGCKHSSKRKVARRRLLLARKAGRRSFFDFLTGNGKQDEATPLMATIVESIRDSVPSASCFNLKSSQVIDFAPLPETIRVRQNTVPRTPHRDDEGPPPPMRTPPPLPLGSHPPCPTSHARLPHACISLSYREHLRPGRGDGRLFTENSNAKAPPAGKQVRFHANIRVTEIPSHVHYTKEVRESMWTTPRQILRNERRNRFEFATEGREWRDCKEEHDFVVWSTTGKLLHPATHARLYQQLVAKRKLAAAKRNVTLLLSEEKPPPNKSQPGPVIPTNCGNAHLKNISLGGLTEL